MKTAPSGHVNTFGGAFDFGSFELRGEYEAIDISDGNINALMLSGVYKF